MKDNHKYLKRFLAFALSVAMVITYMPVNLIAYAETEAPEQPVAEEVVNDTASTEAPAPQEEVKTEEPAPVQEEVTETEPEPVEEPVVTEESSPAEGEQQQAEQPEEVVEETPAEETTEPEEEEAFPAQTFNADKGGVKVLVKAPEGALPEGTEMVVTPANTKAVEQAVKDAVDGEVTGFKAVDITFVKDGKDLEPKVPVQVYLNASGLDKAADKSVVHIADNGVAEVVNNASVNKAGIAKVVTDQFSVYVVVETGDDARLKVNFHQLDGNVVTMMITKNQISQIEKYIYDPGAGTIPEGAQFRGWTDKEKYTTADIENEMTIADVRKAVEAKLATNPSDGDKIDFYAMAFKSYTVTYLDEEGVTLKNEQKIYAISDTETHNYEVNLSYIPYVKPEYDSLGVSAEFAGWEDTASHKIYQNGESFAISENVILQAKVDTGYWITYSDNLKGATYTQPEFVKDGESATKPNDPTRSGYVFEAWYTEDASAERDGEVAGEAFDFTKPLTKTTIVYGKWNKNTQASYNVVVWKQNAAGGDKYDYEETIEVKNASVGSNTYPINASGSGNSRVAVVNTSASASRTVSYHGFHLSTTKGTNGNGYDKPVTVAPENNTVINVYFDRNTITYNFGSYGSYSGLYGAPFTEWPDPGNGYCWYHSGTWFPLPLTEFKPENVETNPGTTTEFTFRRDDYSTPYTLTVYKEDVNGTWVYDNAHTIATARLGGGTWYPTETYTGYTLDAYRVGNGSWTSITPTGSINYRNNFALRYKRNTHDINYVDGVYGVYTESGFAPITESKLPDSYFTNATDIRYEADISDKGNYTPTRDGYVFLGWYTDENCLAEYDFDTMPDYNVTVYAKWVAAELTVELHPNSENVKFADPNQPLKFHSDYGEKVGNPGASHDALDLVGWYSDEALTKAFDFSVFELNDTTISKYGDPSYRESDRKSVVGKIDLYAKWRSKLDGSKGIEIEYVPGEGTLTEEDDNYYVDQAEAIAVAAATSNNEDKVFSHWVVQKWNGSSYEPTDEKLFPGETFTVRKDYAQRIDIPESEQTEDGIDKRFVVQLKAEYVEKDKEIKTFINWYNNYDGGKVATSENLKINEATPIPAAPTRTGYEFKGWIRGIEEDGTTTTLTELWLTYEKGAYKYNGNTATQVAADELLVGDGTQHHALYAKWEPIDVDYDVEFYYQNENGEGYTKDTELSETRQAKTDSTVNVTDADKAQTKNDKYKLVNGAPSVFTATVAGDGSTVLKLYFDLNKVPVTVEHYLKGQTTAFKTDTVADQVVGSTYTATPETKYQEKNLTVNSYDPSQAVTVKTTGNVIKIYYTLPLTIKAKTDSKTYDGTALDGAYTVTGALDADTATINSALGTAPSITDVGSKDYLTEEEQGKITGIPEYYDVTYTAGKIEVTKRSVTLTSATDTKIYDGAALTNSTVSVSGDGFVTGEGATYNVTGTQTEVGNSKNTFTYSLNSGTKDANYDINTVEGTLTVTELTDKVTVTITENSGSEKYDGSEKTVTGYEVTNISNPLYKESDFTFSGSATVKGTDAGSYPMELKAADFTNNNKNFKNVEFVIVDGTLEIAKRSVTLTSADDEKVYDGTALTNDEVTVGGDGFVKGEGATYKVTGTQTDVGESKNAFTYTLNEGTKADNYTITKTEGTLTVTALTDKVTVTITEHSGSFKYDGSEKTVTGYDVSIDNELYTTDDFTFKGDATVKGTDAGSYPMQLKAADFTNTSKNFTNVEFVIVDGTLEISKRTVTLTSADDEKVYDGTALTNDEVTVGGDGFAEGEGAAYDVTGTQTEVGESKNAFTYTLNEGTKADNYTITKTEGTLKVTELTDEVTVTITENSGEEKYDGSEKTVTGYTVKISNPLYTENDFTFSGNATVKGTDAGTYNMELKPADFKNTSKNFSKVTFKIVDGTLKITKRSVTLTSADDEKVYDGTALTNDEVTVGGDGFAKGEGATYDVTGTRTEVGNTPNAFTYTLNEETKAANYEISKTEGTLTVTPVEDKVTVTITEHKGSEKYDGTEKTVTGYDVSIDNKLYKESDFTFNGNDTVKGTDAGSYPMELKPADFTNVSKNFNNVEFKIVDGTLEIAKRAVTLTSADATKVYDGNALTNDEVTVSGDGFVKGEGATYDVTGTQTDVGSSANAFTYKLNEGTKAGNYDIETVEGTLTVTALTDKVTVTITENSGSEKYDGKEKTVTDYEVTSISNPLYTDKDFTFDGDATVKGTDAGIYQMNLKPADFTNTSKNFSNVEFVIVDGTLEITKRVVTLTSADDEKVYDGTALTNDKVTVGGDGWADGEGATYDVTGTQTNVGESKNAFTYALNEGTNKDNYTITTVEGTLTVTPVTDKVTVTITGHKDDVDYNGAEQKVEGYDVSIDNELYTEEDFTFSGDATAKGTDVKKSGDDVDSYPMGLKAGDFENISKNFTNVEFVVNDGSLKIEPIDVTIESASAEKVYDGTPLTKHAVTVDGFVEGEGLAAVKVTGTQTYVGSSENTFEYKLFGDSIFRKMLAALNIDDTDAYDPAENGVTKTTKADNYNITTKAGTLTVTDENVDIDDVATKTHEDKEYKLGETVKFTIEVTNIYDAKKTITVEEQEGVTITSESEFKDVEPGAKVTVTAEYVVTEADLLAGSFSNTATVKFSDVDKPYEPKDEVDVEDPKSHLTVDKKTTSKPANGETYALGETITYEVTATNDGNMTLKNIEVTDELTGDSWTVEELAPGESKTFTAEYTVTEKDIIAGSVKNEATATAEPKDPEAPKPEIVPGTTEDPTDESNPHLTVVKETTSTPANGKEYEVGETVTYEITVTNDGNLTVKDIEVKDDLTGDKWNVESLAPEQSQTFNCEYTITEEDAKNGSVTNIATATGITDDPNHPYPTVVPGEKTVPVVEPADDTKKGVKTGDDNNFGGWLAMMLLAGAGASGLFIRRRREDEE